MEILYCFLGIKINLKSANGDIIQSQSILNRMLLSFALRSSGNVQAVTLLLLNVVVCTKRWYYNNAAYISIGGNWCMTLDEKYESEWKMPRMQYGKEKLKGLGSTSSLH